MRINNHFSKAAIWLSLLVLITAACGASPETSQPTLVPTSPPPVQANPTPTLDTGTEAPTETAPASTEVEPTAETSDATSFPDTTSFEWALVAGGLTKPTDLADPADGSGRLLVVEQRGTIRVIESGAVSETFFLDLTDRVGSGGSEQGLLGIALDPGYTENGIFYLNYTDLNGDTMVSRFHRSEGGLAADPNSEEVLLRVDQPYANHNGGDLEFGPDGMLYIGLGDGGSRADPQGNAQNLDTLLGKMLRIDVRDGSGGYNIPADNPFASGGSRQEIWAWGLRNPWRYTFDARTGDLFIADVGQNQYEEVNFLPAGSPPGANFGWDYREGAHSFEGQPPAGTDLIEPIFEYSHDQGCSVTGGYVYRGQVLPEFQGIYLVGDYCSGIIWGLIHGADGQWQSQILFQDAGTISSFGQDSQGELYLLDHSGGTLLRLTRK